MVVSTLSPLVKQRDYLLETTFNNKHTVVSNVFFKDWLEELYQYLENLVETSTLGTSMTRNKPYTVHYMQAYAVLNFEMIIKAIIEEMSVFKHLIPW